MFSPEVEEKIKQAIITVLLIGAVVMGFQIVRFILANLPD